MLAWYGFLFALVRPDCGKEVEQFAWDPSAEASEKFRQISYEVLGDLNHWISVCPTASVSILLRSVAAIRVAEGTRKAVDITKVALQLLPYVRTESSVWSQSWHVPWGPALELLRDLNSPAVEGPVVSRGSRLVEVMASNVVGNYIARFMMAFPSFQSTDRAIKPSEALLLLSFAHLHGTTTFVESGVWKGASSALFAAALPAGRVIAMDLWIQEEARHRLEQLPNVQLLEGNGEVLLPEVVRGSVATGSVSVFIDGPKGEAALHLAAAAARAGASVVGVHDMEDWKDRLRAGVRTDAGLLRGLVFSDDEWYVASYGWLDANAVAGTGGCLAVVEVVD